MTIAKGSTGEAAIKKSSSVRYSVISAASRPLLALQKLREQFRAQTITDYEHIIIYDGPPPSEVNKFFEHEMRADPRCRFESLAEKDGRFGTAPRNRGIEIASGEWIVFADDDDLYHPEYLQAFEDLNLDSNMLGVVRMNNYGTVVPRHSLREFPRECHVGTPCCCFPAKWFREKPDLRWDDDGTYSHDFALVKKCVTAFRPHVRLSQRVLVKAANESILSKRGIMDDQRKRYLNWNEQNEWLRTFSPSKSDRWLSRTMYKLGKALLP